MIFAATPKKIRVMFTPFRDGLQSSFGGKVRLADILPAMEFAAKEAGIRHFEFGGGARYQAPFFYVGEDPFECQDKMREAVGPDVDLQILTRSVSGVTLTTQRLDALEMQARLMAKHGTTWDRNFDYMNDVDNLATTGKPIVDAGMHHQVCVALMGLPFKDETVHTAAFYIDIIQQLLDRGVHFDSVCMKDASGTTDPMTCYETAKGLKKILPPEVILWQHTHDTASMAVSCYMAGIEGGVDGIDLSVRPMASGTVQPDVRSMWHALKGTGYSLDIDHTKMGEIENLLDEGLAEYDFNPVTTTADARVVGFPMPGGAIGPNVHMMKEAGILDRYSEVLAEFPVVVKAGGAWTSVTPGSQQYWLQAFNNVLLGRWKKMNDGYGKAVLGYFGRPPLPPDPEVVKIASEQLEKPPFDGDPLEAAPDSLAAARAALAERGLATTDENVFLVASAIVAGKNMDLNEGIRLLTGKAKIVLPLKKKPEAAPAPAPAETATAAPVFSGPFTTSCTVVENGASRRFTVTIDPPATAKAAPAAALAAAPASGNGTPVYSPFQGKTELVEINVRTGDAVSKGQVVAAVEAMKAKHDVKAPCAGKVLSIDAEIGADIEAGRSILTIGA
ncbi:MAG TPA: biotin/lipoyl-containing protein [Chondromyces sp.]|nr:biotin/lipoyl-containing protein [Chondromyces sp.]